MLIRTQLQLTEEQARALRRIARNEGISVSKLVRRILDRSLSEEQPGRDVRYQRASAIIGKFADRDGATDVASRHDGYLDEAYR